jgi:formylglycine-generating enzyme required for sulfatase activity
MTLNQGEVLQGRYRIVKKLGEGGFGAVYQAWDINLECHRAIKENLDISPQAQRQFKIEAKILNQLSQPNLPRVIDHIIIAAQGQYLVMDYVEGQDLAEMLENGPLPEERVLPWVIQVCDALSYLHAQNPPVIHRDIKPANIKITPGGKAMLVDFGISKIYDPKLSTTMGARAVTPGYSPPEQYGQGSTDARSDLYALGATLYHLLTGQAPPDSVDIMTQSCPPPPPVVDLNPSISNQTGTVIQRAMALDRDTRWQSAHEFKEAITTQPSAEKKRSDPGATSVVPQPTPSVHTATALGDSWQEKVGTSSLGKLAGAGVLLLMISLFLYGTIKLISVLGGEETPTKIAVVVDTTQPPAAIGTDINIPPSQTPSSTAATMLSQTATQAHRGTFVDEHGVEMAWIPAGTFMMGSEFRGEDEQPIHEVYLDRYAIDVFEVTNEKYKECVAVGICDAPKGSNYGYVQYNDHPVVNVSWFDAADYCEWRGASLPTEAEWEKAARGGLEGKLYPWGNEDPTCNNAVENGAQYYTCSGQTVEVGSFAANGFGLFDMAGNVWEWVADWYDGDYYGKSDKKNPLGPENGIARVMRSGSWCSHDTSLRVALRSYDVSVPYFRFDNVGFRCAVSAPGE